MLGPYINTTYGYEVSVVLDGDGRPTYGQINGQPRAAEAAAALHDGLDALVTVARQHARDTEPYAGFAVLGSSGGLFAAAASPIVPEAGSSLDRGSGQPSVLVFAKRLDGAFLDGLGADFGLSGLSFVDAPPADGRAAVRLPTPAGERSWWIAWQPQRPGHGQLGWLLPALLGSVLFCGFTIVVVRNSDRASRAIRESEARFRDIAEAASDWIWETDHDLRLTYVSDHCARETGLDPDDIVGRHDPRSPPASCRPRVKQREHRRSGCRGAVSRRALSTPAGRGEARVLRVAGKPVLAGGALCRLSWHRDGHHGRARPRASRCGSWRITTP